VPEVCRLRAEILTSAAPARPAAVICRVATTGRVSAVSSDELRAAAPTPGVLRELAFELPGATLMRARAEAGAASGWHHHGERDVLGHVVRGRARFEFGPGGTESTEVEEGGFFHVPAGLVHRDVNPLDEPQEIILAVVGDGPLVVNVDGPPGLD
jgi:quercetin dioxygenase-like cupin family protein